MANALIISSMVKITFLGALMINGRDVVIVDAVIATISNSRCLVPCNGCWGMFSNHCLTVTINDDVDHVAGGCIAQVGEQANNVTRTA